MLFIKLSLSTVIFLVSTVNRGKSCNLRAHEFVINKMTDAGNDVCVHMDFLNDLHTRQKTSWVF